MRFDDKTPQVDMLAAVLDNFPVKGMPASIHEPYRKPWAEQLIKRGVRIHPELMEEFPPMADPLPGLRGAAQPNKWLTREEYEAATEPKRQIEKFQETMRELAPEEVKRIEEMSPEQKRLIMQAQVDRLEEVARQIADLKAALEEKSE